jgi:aminomethyltransferase
LNGPNTSYWPIRKDGKIIGKVTSAVYSPRLKQNIALAMVAAEHAILGTDVEVVNRTGLVNEPGTERATIVDRPFYDPQKKIAAS